METKINTIDRVLNEDNLADVCKTVQYSFNKKEVKDEAVKEVLYKEEDEIPEGKKVGNVKTPSSPATYYSATHKGVVHLNAPDSKNFITYNDITEEDVRGWVEDRIGKEEIEVIEKALDKAIEEQKTPTKATGKPW